MAVGAGSCGVDHDDIAGIDAERFGERRAHIVHGLAMRADLEGIVAPSGDCAGGRNRCVRDIGALDLRRDGAALRGRHIAFLDDDLRLGAIRGNGLAHERRNLEALRPCREAAGTLDCAHGHVLALGNDANKRAVADHLH